MSCLVFLALFGLRAIRWPFVFIPTELQSRDVSRTMSGLGWAGLLCEGVLWVNERLEGDLERDLEGDLEGEAIY